MSGVLAGDAANVDLATNGYAANFAECPVGTGMGDGQRVDADGSAAGNYTLTQPTG